MWKNAGDKLMLMAKVFCWIGIIGSVLSGLGLIATALIFRGGLIGFLVGVVTMALGCLISWLSSLGLYTLGENNRLLREVRHYVRHNRG